MNKFDNEYSHYKNPEEFKKLVNARVSVRKFKNDKIPDEVVFDCLDLALLAPNSSNLQLSKVYRIKDPKIKVALGVASFDQSAATTASELIVCVTDYSLWRKHCKQMVVALESQNIEVPKPVFDYYRKLIPFVYTMGFFNILTPLKWLMNNTVGLFRPVPRGPLTSFGLNLRAQKSCALACENLMLAFRSYGYDTCPMEGFDSSRVKKALNLSGHEDVVMIIAAGVREE